MLFKKIKNIAHQIASLDSFLSDDTAYPAGAVESSSFQFGVEVACGNGHHDGPKRELTEADLLHSEEHVVESKQELYMWASAHAFTVLRLNEEP